LGSSRMYIVAKDLFVQLDSAHAILVVVLFLHRHLQSLSDDSRSQRKTHSGSAQGEPSPLKDPKEADWFECVRVAAGMIIEMPTELQKQLLKFYDSPNKILNALLESGNVLLISRLLKLPLFKEYRRRSRGRRDRDPLAFMLRFGEDVLRLKHPSVGKHVGFRCLRWCLEAKDLRRSVRISVLRCCNELSRRLASSAHKLLVVHLIQSLLRFFQARCLESAQADVVVLYEQYKNLAFAPTQPTTSTASPAVSGDSKETKNRLPKNRLPSGSSGIPPPVEANMLLYKICRVKFCMDDLLDRTRAARLRDRLMKEDEMELAEEVWVRCEGGDRAQFARKRKIFVDKMKDQCTEYHEAYEKRPNAG